MPPSRNNTVKFTDLQAISSVNLGDIIPVVDTSVPTLVNKKINVQDFSRSLPVGQQVAQISTVSASWNSSYSTTLTNSAFWSTGGSYGSVYSANSAEYESTFTSVNTVSGAWGSAYSTLNATSGVYTTVQNVSSAWNTGTTLASSAYTSLNTLSTGTWVLKAGDQITGTLTTTKTLTTQFTNLDELVSKRYVDAVSTVSGNFVPSLYYSKTDFNTGVPLVSTALAQFNQATVGVAGSQWYGTININPNQFGTDVPAFVFQTYNQSIGGIGRAGIYVNSVGAGSFSYSQGTVALDWNGPNFTTPFTLTRSGTLRLSIYDDVNLNNNLNILGNTGANNLVFNRWRNTVFGNTVTISGANFTLSGANIASTLPFVVVQDSNVNEITPELTGMWLVRNSVRHGIASTYFGTAISMLGFYYNNVGIGGIQENGGFIVPAGAGFGWSDSAAGNLTYPYSRIGFFREGGYNIGLRPYNDTVSRAGFSNASLKIYNTYTDANNYERLSLSATRIAYEFAGTGVSRDLTIQSTGNLILSAGGVINLSQSLPLYFNSLSAGSVRVSIPQDTISSSFSVVSSNGVTLFSVNSSYDSRVNVLGHIQLDREIYDQPPKLKIQNNNNSSYGELYMASGQLNIDGFNNGFLLPGGINIDPTSKGTSIYTLLTLKGVSFNPQSFIKCLSSDGKTLFEVNSAGSFTASSFTFIAPTDYLGTVRVLNDTAGILRPGIYSTGNGVSLATYGNGGLSNVASAFIQHILGRRAVFSGSNPTTVGNGNFEETISDVAVKIGGKLGFTVASLDGSNQVRPLSASMEYDWGTNLIALSSRIINNNNGFYFYPAGTSFPAPASIYLDSSSFLNINVQFGAGKTIRFTDGINTPLTLAFPSNGQTAIGDWSFNTFTTTTNNVTINQSVNHVGTLFRVLSTNSTAMFSVSSDGISRFNNRVFIRPTGLIQFNDIGSTTPAIKGTSTTIQARTGDDSQYTFLQGKIQTDQAASAGTFTPDKYIILYDSTGTAYKVPVQAL